MDMPTLLSAFKTQVTLKTYLLHYYCVLQPLRSSISRFLRLRLPSMVQFSWYTLMQFHFSKSRGIPGLMHVTFLFVSYSSSLNRCRMSIMSFNVVWSTSSFLAKITRTYVRLHIRPNAEQTLLLVFWRTKLR